MYFELIYTPNECHILPSLVVSAGQCQNPDCADVHGWQIFTQWLWWGCALTWGVD